MFEKYLKPLRSKNARLIFKVFTEQGKERVITTLDIETKLLEYKLELDKKEINGYLVSLSNAGLISKDMERGKPTTIKYEDKYTFDLWRITELGIEVGEWIQDFIYERLALKDNVLKFLNRIKNLEKLERDVEIRKIKEKCVVIRCLEVLSINKNITNIELKEKINFNFYEIGEILLKYSSQKSVQHALFDIVQEKGLINRFKRFFGAPLLYSCKLSEYGETIANKFTNVKYQDV
ncbi:MAG: hypothetical protein ACUVV4_08750 [Candidatus Bathyarchaeia archaeon]